MSIKNVLGFGKDQSSTAKPLGITGEENDEIKITDVDGGKDADL